MGKSRALARIVLLTALILLLVSLQRAWSQTIFTRSTDALNPIVTNASSGNYRGCAWIDYDNDNFLDLFVVSSGGSFLYHNDGGLGFSRVVGVAMSTDPGTYLGTSWGTTTTMATWIAGCRASTVRCFETTVLARSSNATPPILA